MKLTKTLIAAIASVAIHQSTFAQPETYPSRPIRIIVPYGTGGGSDVLARQIAAQLQDIWKQGIAVENRAGASGNIGTEAVVRSPADGYTLLLQNSTMVVNPAIAGKLNYDPEKDLTPIMLLGVTPIALAAHPSLNVKNLKELQELVKAKPNTLSYGSCGLGTPQHFVMELVKQRANIDANHVGYKGCAPGLTDVLGGQIPLAMLSANLIAPHIKSGKLIAIGMSTSKRYNLMPDTPSFEELGLKPLDFANWYSLMGPAKMPPDIVNKIRNEINKILANPDIQSRLSNAGVEVTVGDGNALAQLIKLDLARYAQLAKSANIKGE